MKMNTIKEFDEIVTKFAKIKHKENKLNSIIIKLFNKLKVFYYELDFASYNISFQGISKIEEIGFNDLRIYSQTQKNKRKKSITFLPYGMRISKYKETTGISILTQGDGDYYETLVSYEENDDLQIENYHVITIYPCSSWLKQDEFRQEMLRELFFLKPNKNNIRNYNI